MSSLALRSYLLAMNAARCRTNLGPSKVELHRFTSELVRFHAQANDDQAKCSRCGAASDIAEGGHCQRASAFASVGLHRSPRVKAERTDPFSDKLSETTGGSTPPTGASSYGARD
jgi:hypothetical protein